MNAATLAAIPLGRPLRVRRGGPPVDPAMHVMGALMAIGIPLMILSTMVSRRWGWVIFGCYATALGLTGLCAFRRKG
jgi:hypothetical protein